MCDQWKMLQCWRRTGHLPSCFVPTPGDLTAQEFPPPRICYPSKKKSSARPGEGGGGTWRSWNWLMHYEGENFSDSSFHHIFESENFRFPFFYEKYPNLASEMWNCKIKLQKIVANFIDKVIDNSGQYLLLRLRYFTVNSRWVPLNRQSLKYYRLSETSWKIHRGIPLWSTTSRKTSSWCLLSLSNQKISHSFLNAPSAIISHAFAPDPRKTRGYFFD